MTRRSWPFNTRISELGGPTQRARFVDDGEGATYQEDEEDGRRGVGHAHR